MSTSYDARWTSIAVRGEVGGLLLEAASLRRMRDKVDSVRRYPDDECECGRVIDRAELARGSLSSQKRKEKKGNG